MWPCSGPGGLSVPILPYRLSSENRYELTLLDISDAKLRLRFQNKPFTFRKCDISKDRDLVEEIVASHDVVFDLAAYVHPGSFIADPLEVVKLNFFDTLKIIEACARHECRLIHFSTCEVYGKTGGSAEPFAEDASDCIVGPIANHRWIYSSAKQLLDRIIHAHGLAGDLEYTIVRPFNFVGPLMDFLMDSPDMGNPRVFAHFMSALIYGRALQLVDGGHSMRCFTDIEDGTRALQKILEHPEETRNQIINIGNPENETTIHDSRPAHEAAL
ncbi:MAG: NAD-dependent epimerase/dehydratase family protein [Gammaproteobacteria bacterium]|nr:NAD-dependent epimerase/dehydratase family protein [Gammaproteobacteria bacterium]